MTILDEINRSGKEPQPSPIEVWLRQDNMTVSCTVVRQDESTDPVPVDSLSMRGAQREITGWLIGEGYTPVGRWETEAEISDVRVREVTECSRRFKVK